MTDLENAKIAILMTDGFEHSEFQKPYEALKEKNADVEVVSLKVEKIKSWKDGNWGEEVNVDKTVDQVSASDYRGLVLPGGVINPDKLRMNDKAVEFVKGFFEEGKPIAAICHGPWTMIETGALKGRKLTSYPSLRTDLENAGATWEDKEVVVDQGLVTSRNPDDLPAFCKKMVEEFREGVHEGQTL